MKQKIQLQINKCPHCQTSSSDFLKVTQIEGISLLLNDTKSIHHQVNCQVCGATGPLGRTSDESIILWNKK